MVGELCAQYPRDHSAIAFLNFFLNSGAQVDGRAGNGLNALHCSAAKASLEYCDFIAAKWSGPQYTSKRNSFHAIGEQSGSYTTSMEIPKMETSLSAPINGGF